MASSSRVLCPHLLLTFTFILLAATYVHMLVHPCEQFTDNIPADQCEEIVNEGKCYTERFYRKCKNSCCYEIGFEYSDDDSNELETMTNRAYRQCKRKGLTDAIDLNLCVEHKEFCFQEDKEDWIAMHCALFCCIQNKVRDFKERKALRKCTAQGLEDNLSLERCFQKQRYCHKSSRQVWVAENCALFCCVLKEMEEPIGTTTPDTCSIYTDTGKPRLRCHERATEVPSKCEQKDSTPRWRHWFENCRKSCCEEGYVEDTTTTTDYCSMYENQREDCERRANADPSKCELRYTTQWWRRWFSKCEKACCEAGYDIEESTTTSNPAPITECSHLTNTGNRCYYFATMDPSKCLLKDTSDRWRRWFDKCEKACCEEGVLDDIEDGDIRILGNHQCLQIAYNNTYGFVCDDSWDIVDADVACRQLGYPRAHRTWICKGCGHLVDEVAAPIYLDETKCKGTESKLHDCPSNPPGSHNCNTDEVVALQCFDSCDLEDHYAAPPEQVCKGHTGTLTCNAGGLIEVQKATFKGNSRGICKDTDRSNNKLHADVIECVSKHCDGKRRCEFVLEKQFLQGCARFKNGDALHIEYICRFYEGEPILFGGVDEDDYSEGAVHIFHDGCWGGVCGQFFDTTDADVICLEMGYGPVVQEGCCQTYEEGDFSTELQFIDELQCSGQECHVLDCERSHDRLGNVKCKPVYIQCQQKVKLVGGHHEGEGIALVWNDDSCEWNTMCFCPKMSTNSLFDEMLFTGLPNALMDDRAIAKGNPQRWISKNPTVISQLMTRDDPINEKCYGWYWQAENSDVICKELGYSRAIVDTPFDMAFQYQFPTEYATPWPYLISCEGDEDSIRYCNPLVPISGHHDCNLHGGDVAVRCDCGEYGDYNGQVRLVNGKVPNKDGIVQIFYEGCWGTVCTGTSWGKEEATVVCRQLGYKTGQPLYGMTPKVFFFKISDINKRFISEGLSFGWFGPDINSDSYDLSDKHNYKQVDGTIWLDGQSLNCHGSEGTLLNCPFVRTPAQYCDHSMDVAVKCFDTLDCFHEHTEKKGCIDWPRDDGRQFYRNNEYCVWNILIKKVDAIQFTVKFIDLESNCGDCQDYIRIEAGISDLEWKPVSRAWNKVSCEICSLPKNKIIFNAQANAARIRFSSNKKVVGRGFKVCWEGGMMADFGIPDTTTSPKTMDGALPFPVNIFENM